MVGGIVAHPESPKPELAWRQWNLPFDAVETTNLDTSWRLWAQQAAGGALGDFVTEMQVGHRQPALPAVIERKEPVEDNILRNKRLASGENRHQGAGSREIIACHSLLQSVCQRFVLMNQLLKFSLAAACVCSLVSCATPTTRSLAISGQSV